MPKTPWAFALTGLLVGVHCSGKLAAAPAPAPSAHANFTVKKWDTDDRLPENVVIAMAQTRDGYLWLGTLNGLARFDGIRFTVFNAYNTPGLGSSRITFLFADRHDNLWVGTDTAGAVLIKNGRVTPLEFGSHGREGRLIAVAEDGRGAVWLCTADGRLCRYLNGDMSVWQLRGPKAVGEYRALAVEAGGSLWIGADHLLAEIDTAKIVAGQSLPPHQEFVPGKLDFLLTSSRGGFWLLANGRVQLYQTNRIARDFGLYPWGPAPVKAACEDRQGNLIVGTQDRGLTWFDADGRAETLTDSQGLTHNTVLSLHVDREGSLWVGTDSGGVNRVKRQSFEVLAEPRPSVVLSVCEDAAGGLWLASTDVELKYYHNGAFRNYGRAQGLLDVNLRSVFVDRNQKVWVGTLDGGLFQLDGERFRAVPKSEIVPRGVSAIHQDRAGLLWVGTQGGLARWDGQDWQLFKATNGLASDKIAAIADDPTGALWIGTDRGLSRLRDGRFDSFHVEDGLPGEDVSALLADDLGVVWVGTRGKGLARFADGKWTRYSTDNGLADNGINYLAEDGQGYLWIGSFTGLMRVPKTDLNQFAEGRISAVRCRAYGSADGLPTAECSSGSQPAACRTRAGKLWFPTIRGLVSVDPAQLVRNTNPPPVMIEAVWVDDQLQNTNRLRSNWPEALTIPAGRERLEIRYTSLNLLAPERARFKFQMEGHESAPTDAGDTRVARYSNLPPGHYTFRVTACNEDGEWNKIGASLAITVEPPFWRTWWFLALSAACFLGLIVATVHFISTQKLQRQLAQLRQKEALEKERARIARDLHDQLGANLTQVSLLGEMVETDKDLPGEVEAHARQISQTARVTALALDEIVWAANPANDTLEGLVTYVCKYAQEYFTLAGLSCRLEVSEQLPSMPVPPDVRHNVFLAFKEAVNNVVKHAQATAVRVRLVVGPDYFKFEIEDNGRGLPAGAKDKGRNGLRNMRKRMEDVGGEFSVDPAAERGTRVCLTAPIRKE
jgi:ligand-binding sensor domain-containing protein/signal transduction histidine kinase